MDCPPELTHSKAVFIEALTARDLLYLWLPVFAQPVPLLLLRLDQRAIAGV